jgi:hypothetical protein
MILLFLHLPTKSTATPCSYSTRSTAAIGPLQLELRAEIFTQPYASVDWRGTINSVCELDLYSPHTRTMDAAFWAFRLYERWCPRFLERRLRAAGAAFALEYVNAEDLQTNYVDIGPVNKVVNMLSVWYAGGRSAATEAFRRHVARVDDYLWVAEDGECTV